MTENIREFPKWAVIVAVSYFVVLLFEIEVVFPIEQSIISHFHPDIVSLVFLPHAVRVLSTVICGPRVFFVLFPTILIAGYFLFESYSGGPYLRLITDAAIGASCAPLAYLAVKWANRNNPAFELSLQNWRMVFVIGVTASILNSVMRVPLLGHYQGISHLFEMVAKVILGDMVGLSIGLVVMVFVFRMIRRGQI